MKIGIAHGWGWEVGGAEVYLRGLIPALHELGHEVSMGYVMPSADPAKGPYWSDAVGSYNLSESGPMGLEGFLHWDPDLIYVNIVLDTRIWDGFLGSRCACVYFAHSFMATCVSGSKTHRWPRVEPCTKTLGLGCLLHYFPRRCGGLSPVTMLNAFVQHTALLKRVRRCNRVLTHSEHMRAELARHLGQDQVQRIPFCLPGFDQPQVDGASGGRCDRDTVNLLFLGRLEDEKGGRYLLEALPKIRLSAGQKLRLVIAGQGTRASSWQALAKGIQEAHPWIRTEFVGWVEGADKTEAIAEADIFVMPSVWPEPLGMAPLEALSMGVPVAGFPRGGYAEHIQDGVNGYLAPEPVSAAGLASAIQNCIHDKTLRAGVGLQGSRRIVSVAEHALELESVFKQVLDGSGQPNI